MSVLSIEILFGSNETLFVRQTWKRLKESFHSCIVRATFTQDSPVMFWTKSQRQQNCHETSALYSSCCLWPADFAFNLFYVACLLGWKISRLFQDTKVYEPPQYQPRWSWQKPEINSIYRTVFSTDRAQIFGRVRSMFPSVLCLCDQPHVSTAWGAEGHSLFCINTWDSTSISETASRSHPYRAGN